MITTLVQLQPNRAEGKTRLWRGLISLGLGLERPATAGRSLVRPVIRQGEQSDDRTSPDVLITIYFYNKQASTFMFLKNRIPPYPQVDDSTWGSIKMFVWETVKVVVISLAIIVPVRYFLIQPFYVKGASMEPNYLDHEYLIIDELSYRFREPVRGEVIVFRPSNDRRQFYIKRVIGLPGERVKITGGTVYLYSEENPAGETLQEDYLDLNTVTQGEVDIRLKEGQYFVLGDHRNASLDSRVFGAVEQSDIVGRTWVRGWPLDRIMVFRVPQ